MKYIVDAQEMKTFDQNTIQKTGIPSMVLMERASVATADFIQQTYGNELRILILAGSGNNGGDGIAIARILKERGMNTEILLCGNENHFTPETKQQLMIAQNLNIPVSSEITLWDYDLYVDAIFGIGLSRKVEGHYAELIENLNLMKSPIISVDIPSGIDASTGEVLGIAVKASYTITFGFEKLGLILYPGNTYAGKIKCMDMGINEHSFYSQTPSFYTFDHSDVSLPARNPNGNKGTFGKVFLIAGSKMMYGACIFAALSAYRMGVGMVKILTHEDNIENLKKKIPEALLASYNDNTSEESLRKSIEEGISWSNVIAIGPGIGCDLSSQQLIKILFETNNSTPVVCDADALNILAKNQDLMNLIKIGNRRSNYDLVFTPHVAEFSRLCHIPMKELKNNIFHEATKFVSQYDVVLACKDARSIVMKQGEQSYLNITGNDGMATAGSGDVLTGIITGLMAQGMSGYKAACLGEYLHGFAGDIAKKKTNAYYIMAQDIISSLQYLQKEVN